MKIIRSKYIGFCFGVRRASEMVERLLAAGQGGLVTIGPLIHNPQEVARLAELGVRPVEDMNEAQGHRAVVRTHGIEAGQVELARRLGVELIDATCPYVETPRRKMNQLAARGRVVLLVGDASHPEIRAQLSHATGSVLVIRDESELPDLAVDVPVALVAQTTLREDVFERTCQAARDRFSDVVVANTICQDAHRRQQAVRELAARVDAMIVVGGRNSSNTTRLAEICQAIQPRSFHVESAAEIGGLALAGAEVVGLTSGASTPDWLIDQVEEALRAR